MWCFLYVHVLFSRPFWSGHASHHLNLDNLKKGNAERSTDFLGIFLAIPLQKNFALLYYIYMPMTYTDQKYKA